MKCWYKYECALTTVFKDWLHEACSGVRWRLILNNVLTPDVPGTLSACQHTALPSDTSLHPTAITWHLSPSPHLRRGLREQHMGDSGSWSDGGLLLLLLLNDLFVGRLTYVVCPGTLFKDTTWDHCPLKQASRSVTSCSVDKFDHTHLAFLFCASDHNT